MRKLKTKEEKLAGRRKYQNNKRRNRRIEVINLFGGKCVKCGFDDWRALQIDHVNGWGSKERRQFKDTYSYLELCVQNINTDKYQLLCANCNWIKRYEQFEEKGRIEGKIYGK